MENQRKFAALIAILVAALWIGCMFYFSEGVAHYWIDESTGPDYVRYDRTLPEMFGVWVIVVTFGSAIVIAIYYGLKP